MDEGTGTIVVLGGTPGISATMPFFPRGDRQPIFPLPIKCASYKEAQQVNRLHVFVQRMIMEKLDPEAMQARVMMSSFIGGFHGSYYAVYRGKKAGIYTECPKKPTPFMKTQAPPGLFSLHSDFSNMSFSSTSSDRTFRRLPSPDLFQSPSPLPRPDLFLHQHTVEAPKQYRSTSCKILLDIQQCRPIRLKEKCIRQKKTTAEKKADKEKRKAEREDYLEACEAVWEVINEEAWKLHARFGGHSEQRYKEDLLQIGCLKKDQRAVSRWNAYLHHESQKAHANSDGQCLKAHELAAALKEKWNAMSEEEKIAVMDPLIAKLKERKADTKFGTHNVPLEAFGDATQCLQAMENYFKMTPAELSMRMEAFCLTGVKGMVNKHTSGMAELKTKLKDLINTSLVEIIGGKVRMTYVGFEDRFTVPYGMLIEKWPLSRFCAPSELTRAEVDVFLGTWTSGMTHFRKMPDQEWEKWHEEHLAALADTSGTCKFILAG
ncbi:hypothetical protein C0992_002603 [Termitomyces sp. T32_za158]|nr:hypothetical protein C0992_002603 [Termitomyces sp. T32_za158]